MPTPVAPLFWDDDIEHRRKIALALNAGLRGQLNNCQTITLTASATSTTFTDERVTLDTVAVLQPLTASAATAIGAGVVYTTVAAGVVTIHHDSDPATDRTFGLVLFC